MINNSMFWSVLKSFFAQKQKQTNVLKNKSLSLEYNGRSGYAVFRDGHKTIRFYTEVGGGDCIFYMDIPSPKDWSSLTGYPLVRRDDILKFMAEEALRLQINSPGSYYRIEDKYISFYQK